MRRFRLQAASFALIVVVSGCSNTDRRDPPPDQPAVGTGGAGADVNSDSDFVHKIAGMHAAQLGLSRIALQKSTSPEIRAFAQKTIDDHAAAETQLKGILSGASIGWHSELDDKKRNKVDGLAKEQGADFDREYAEAMVEAHQDLAAMLESRLDVQSVAEWKTAAAGRAHGQAMPDPKTQMRDVPVRPARSDSAMTGRINQWAADTYPVAQKHLDTARQLETMVKQGS